MRLLEAIIAANHAAAEGRRGEIQLGEFVDSLPLAALTCIDPRLNKLFPGALGLTDDQFIWLRNAGNVITNSTSSTARSVALSIYIKNAKEIAIIGHTDCKMSQLTMMALLDKFQEQGISRSALQMPNLQEFFGLFSSETQNVIKGVGFLRQSPLIPTKVPVHGLVVNTNSGRLEWVVNGYDTLGQPSQPAPVAHLREVVESHLPESTPMMIKDELSTLLDKVEPLLARKWDSVTTKVGEEIERVAHKASPTRPSPVPPIVKPPPQPKVEGKIPLKVSKRSDPWGRH